jgi:hypothetical protein
MYLAFAKRGLGVTGGQEIAASGGVLLSAAPFTGPAAPFLAIAGAITEFLGAMGVGSGCGQTCVLSTEYANQASALLGQNIAAYFAIAAPRPLSAQTAALANFATIWADFVQQCQNPALGSQGETAISERQAGSCAWTQLASSVPPWGVPAAGQCWNWWAGYHDPIANDTHVYDDSAGAAVSNAAASVSSAVSGGASFAGVSNGLLVALVAVAVVVWAVAS